MEYLNDKMDFWARRAEEEGNTNHHHREQTESDGDEVVLTTTNRRKILSSSPSPPATMVVNNDEEDSSSTAGQSDSPCYADNNANDDDQDSLIDYTDDDDDDDDATASASSSSSPSTIEGSDDEWFKHCQTYPQSSRHDQEDNLDDAEEGETRPAYYGNVVYQSRHHDPHYNDDYCGDGYEQFERSEDEEDQADYFDLPDDRESAGPRRFRNSPVVGGSGDDDCYQHDRDRNEDFFENCYAAYYGEDEEEDDGCEADGGGDREVGRYPPGGSEPTLPFALPKPRSWNPLAIAGGGGGGGDYENNQALSDEENNLDDDDDDGTTSPPPSLAATLLTLEALAEAKRTHFREDLPWNYDAKALRRFGRKPREVVVREIKVLKKQIATESAFST